MVVAATAAIVSALRGPGEPPARTAAPRVAPGKSSWPAITVAISRMRRMREACRGRCTRDECRPRTQDALPLEHTRFEVHPVALHFGLALKSLPSLPNTPMAAPGATLRAQCSRRCAARPRCAGSREWAQCRWDRGPAPPAPEGGGPGPLALAARRHRLWRPAHADSGDEVLAVVAEVVEMALAKNAQHLPGFVHRSAPAPPAQGPTRGLATV